MKIEIENKIENWKASRSCRGCHSSLILSHDDVNYDQIDNGEDFISEYYFICPLCQYETSFESIKTFPDLILDNARERYFRNGRTDTKSVSLKPTEAPAKSWGPKTVLTCVLSMLLGLGFTATVLYYLSHHVK